MSRPKGSKLTEEHKRNISNALEGKALSKEHYKNVLKANRKAAQSAERNKKLSLAATRNWQDPVYRAKHSAGMKRARKDPEYKKKHSQSCKDSWKRNYSYRADINRKNAQTAAAREKRAIIQRELWRNAEYKKTQVIAIMRGWHRRPTKPELYLQNILETIVPGEYKYVGDGQFILGGKCPDFMNVNGKKKLIELYGDYWHRGQDPQVRINYFKQFGFDTFVIWESELKKIEIVKEKLLKFSEGK